MNYLDFITKQNRIYGEFRDTSKVMTEGIAPKIFENEGGYIIGYRHHENIVDGVEEFSEKVSKIAPSIKYHKDNLHTTFATYKVSNNFQIDKYVLEKLSNIINSNISLIKEVEIDYSEWLIDQTTGIVGGMPNKEFFENGEIIVEAARKEDIELKLPWGAHITTNRFLETIPKEQLVELISLFKNSKPLGISKPKYIDVGYFNTTPKEFRFNVHKRFEL